MLNRQTFISAILLSTSTNFAFANGWEVGSRVWLSEGETEWSHCASLSCGGESVSITISDTSYTAYGGDPTSKLNYSDTKATVLEVFANYRADNLLTMAKIGTGSGYGGSFRDQDWLTTTNGVYNNLEYSDTLSGTKNTDVNYWMVDFGYPLNFFYESPSSEQSFQITPFVGYFNYDESLNAYGLTPVYDGDFNVASSEPYSTKVISNEINWSGIRLGVDLKTEIDENLKFNANIAYAIVDAENKDSHLLRTSSFALGPAPNIISKGDGDGVMLDLLLNYQHDNQLDFEIGYRYWDLDADSATTSFGPSFSTAYPSRSLYSIRSGLLIGAKYKF